MEVNLKENFKKKVLNNGLTVLFEKRDIPVVSVAFAVKNGGVNESLSEKGISHFIEHMLYKGTSTRSSKKIAEEIEKNGGELNGFTDETITAYWCKIPSKHLPIALEVLGDMVKNPLFNPQEIEKERKVIFEEIKLCHDVPTRYVLDEIERLLYKEPLGCPLIGTYESMNSIGREKIFKRFIEVYQPDNMVLCVVGDADFKDIVSFAENFFGNEKGNISHFDIHLKNESKIEKRRGIDQANLVFAYHVPLSSDKKSHSANALNVLMAGGMSSRLFQEIREKRNLAYAVKGGSEITKYFGHSFIYVGTMKENVEKVKELILEEFMKVEKELTEKELNEVKEQIIGNYYIFMEDSQSQMVNLLYHEIDGKAEDFYDFEKNIRNVKLSDVRELAGKAAEKFSFFALIPED